MTELEALRRRAVAHSLVQEPGIAKALARLGFVQADPIRAPARAQDLILRPRVADYRAGDLEAKFSALGLAEDMVHVYGFLPGESLRLLHPRRRHDGWPVERDHPHLRRAILGHLKRHGPTHPRHLNEHLGGHSVQNGWGGNSAATTQMLELLHREGRLAVVGREAGIRIYGLALPRRVELTPTQRAQGLILLLANLYAPMPLASLRQLLLALRRRVPEGIDLPVVMARMIRQGMLTSAELAGMPYVWPAQSEHSAADDLDPERVCLLAPFDPIVWDRRRFEHLWGWPYRFEAYTPPGKRRFGYYALPILWRAEIIGWANLELSGPRLSVEPGYVRGKPPRERAFRIGLEEEMGRMERFLDVAGKTRAS